MNFQTAVQISNLSVIYKTPVRRHLPLPFPFPFHFTTQVPHLAVDNVNLKIEANKVTALLGKNGSGKTSIIKTLIGFRNPSAGEIKIFGKSPREISHDVGFCFGGSLVYHRLTARENLEYFGQLYNIQNLELRIEELAKVLELTENLDQMVEAFSYGMKAKLALARALLHKPKLIILDEPTLGIDFEMATLIRGFIKSLDCTVLLTTHYMEEVEDLAQDIVILDHGKILYCGTKEQTLSHYKTRSISEAFHLALQPLTKNAA